MDRESIGTFYSFHVRPVLLWKCLPAAAAVPYSSLLGLRRFLKYMTHWR